MPKPPQYHSSFIIATRNRAGDLLRTVESLVTQTVLPTELCIVDASEDAPSKPAIARLCNEAGIGLDYVHPAPSGLPRQRNIGIDRTAGDPVFFIDDDVWLDPHCHQEVLAQYELGGPGLGGVCPSTLAEKQTPQLMRRYYRTVSSLFGLGGWWPDASSKVTRAFFVRGPTESTCPRYVDCFKGHFMSFRRAMFERERFDEELTDYAWKEDFDLSYRVSRRFGLLISPSARCRHFQSPTGRDSRGSLGRMKVANQFYLHRKLMPQNRLSRAALWWSMLGMLLIELPAAIKTGNLGSAGGVIAGIRDERRRRTTRSAVTAR